jgi:hypothetical protein
MSVSFLDSYVNDSSFKVPGDAHTENRKRHRKGDEGEFRKSKQNNKI